MLDELERLEKEEQQRLAKITLKAGKKHSMDELHLPEIKDKSYTQNNDEYFITTSNSPIKNRSLTSDFVYAKSTVKKDNEYGIRPGEKFAVVSWNPFIISSLSSGKTLNSPDPTLFTP